MVGMDAPPPPIGHKIKRARERLRITQAELGARVGVSQKTIDNWEHDKRYPKSSIGALEEVLGLSFADGAGPGPSTATQEELDQAVGRAQQALQDALLAQARGRGGEPNGGGRPKAS
jgi:DNA-binding XRE family transcriptional regulator